MSESVNIESNGKMVVLKVDGKEIGVIMFPPVGPSIYLYPETPLNAIFVESSYKPVEKTKTKYKTTIYEFADKK